MEEKLDLEIVTPYGKVLEGNFDEITAPGKLGEFGVLPGHAPFISMLDIGVLTSKAGSSVKKIFINSGYADVNFNKVIILANSAELAENIDIERARSAQDRAIDRLKKADLKDLDIIRAEAALKRALTRLEVAGK